MAHILVADDDPTHLEMVGRALSRAGHDVVYASNGGACLRHLEAGGIDLVVTDVLMPGTDGMQLLMAMQAKGWMVPVIGMTGGIAGGVTRPFENSMLSLGAETVLRKPFEPQELVAQVRGMLGRERNA